MIKAIGGMPTGVNDRMKNVYSSAVKCYASAQR